MPEEGKTKKIQVFQLCKETNLSKEDILSYLINTLGLQNVTLNTKLDSETVNKVYNHFKKEIEEHNKHKKRILDFTTKTGVDISEAQEIKRKQEEEKRRKEEQERIKKALEEERRKEAEEKRKQELLAIKEREKLLKKEQEEKEAKQKELIKLYEAKRIEEEQKKKEKEKKEIKKEPIKEKPKPPIKEEKKESKVKGTPKIEIVKEKQKEAKSPEKKFDKSFKKRKKIDKNKEFKKGKEITFGPGKDEKKDTEKNIIKPEELKKPIENKDIKIGRGKTHKAINDTIDYEKKRKQKIVKQKEAKLKRQQIEELIQETLQKMEGPLSLRAIARRKKKKERLEKEKKLQEFAKSTQNVLQVTEFITTDELAKLMQIKPSEVIKKSLEVGEIVTLNQRLNKALIEIIADSFGFKIEFQKEYQEDLLKDFDDPPEKLKPRPPVVAVMGHVDHGKTSLLDYIRKSNIVAGEAGGITQHIGAYKVRLDEKDGKEITFLDTPGHQAFTAMRARGGQAADIVILVVAADDAVMPQTVEAINHALAANVPIIVAINKIDKPESNPDRIRQQLAEHNILVEEWGGKYQSVEISAKFGKNIDLLLEKILLEAEILDLKANPDRNARGVVIESKMDKGRGITATVLVQKGTLKIGDVFVAGMCSGKVKAMFDERERRMQIATPSTPVQILGFDNMPQAGDTFVCLDSEVLAREIAKKRQQLKREQDFRTIKFITLDDISNQIKKGKQVDLKVIIKADVDGSVEAIADSLLKLSTPEAKISVVHKAVGQITESDILLAEASNAIVIGFNVRPNLNARKLAEQNKIDIRLHNVIYNVIDEVKKALEGLLEPDKKEEITAIVEIKSVFKIPKVGNVAGCYVQEGKISRNNKIRLIRDGLVIYEGNILSLKRLKDDVKEVDAKYECGIAIENFNDIKVGDIIEAYKIVETKKTLTFDKV